MDDQIERMVISVRADTAGFTRDVATMRGDLEGPLANGASRAGRVIENALGKALATGKFGFEDMKKVALQAMAQIASASLKSLFGPPAGAGGGSGVSGILSSAISGLLGLPGRATGGPVSAGRAYMVGERGPELFVPGSAGRVERLGAGTGRDVRVSIAVSSPQADDPQLLRRSSRQLALAVRSAIRNDGR